MVNDSVHGLGWEQFKAYTFYIYSLCLLISLGGLEIFSALAAVASLLYVIINRKVIAPIGLKDLASSKTMVFGFIFFIATAISAAMSPIKEQAFDAVGANRNIFLLLFLSFLWQKQFLNLRKYFIPIALFSGLFVSLYCFYQFFTGVDLMRPNNPHNEPIGSFFRSAGFFGMPLTFAYSCGLQLFFLLPYQLTEAFKKEAPRFKFFYYLCLVLMTMALFTTSVRGAWLSFAIVFATFILALDSSKLKATLSAVSASGVAVLFGVESFRDRILSIVDMENLSNVGRFIIWKSTTLLWLENPIFGVGLNVSDDAVGEIYHKYNMEPPTLGFSHHAHNDFLQVLVGTGIVGFIPFCLFILSFLWLSYKGYKRLKQKSDDQFYTFLGGFLALTFFCIGSMTQCNYTDREVNHMLTFVFCILLVNYLKNKKELIL